MRQSRKNFGFETEKSLAAKDFCGDHKWFLRTLIVVAPDHIKVEINIVYVVLFIRFTAMIDANMNLKQESAMDVIEMTRARIVNKGMRYTDIKHNGLLTDDQIADIPVEQVYLWVRQGLWSQKDFKKWLKVLRVI